MDKKPKTKPKKQPTRPPYCKKDDAMLGFRNDIARIKS